MKKWTAIAAGLCLAVSGSFGEDEAAEKLKEAGHWKRLRAMEEPKVKANPGDAEASYYLGRAKSELGDLPEALALAEKAVASNPNDARYHLLVADVSIAMAQNAGIFKGMGLARRYREEAEKALALDGRYVEARESLMEFYFEAPGIGGGDKKKAHAQADEIGKIDAVRGWLAQAWLSAKEKNEEKEVEFYQKALAAGPRDGRVLRAAAAFYGSESQKKFDLAETYGLAAVRADENLTAPYVALATVYATAERWKDLDQILSQCEKNAPDDFGAHYQVGKVLLNSGKELARAERYFRKYLTVEPEGGEPPLAAAHWRLGLVLEKEGKKAEAISEIEESLRLDGNFKQAKEDLKRLKK